jgi:phosphate transport system substrate-binding protein
MLLGKLRLALLGGAIVLALGLLGCGEDSAPLRGSIRIDGSRTLAPLTREMAKRFTAEHPDVHIAVGVSGTDRGFAKLCRGEADATNANDRIEARESAACERGDVAWAEIPVVNDALLVLTNPTSPVRCLTTTQLHQIWQRNSEVTSRWTQVNGIPRSNHENLTAWGPGTDTETYALFTKAVNGREGPHRDYNNTLHRESWVIGGVANMQGAIGYIDYAIYQRSSGRINVLALDSGAGCIDPSPRSIADGSYGPLSRELFVYPSTAALARPAMQAFLRFYLDNVEAVAPKVGFVALEDGRLAASRATLERLIVAARRARGAA